MRENKTIANTGTAIVTSLGLIITVAIITTGFMGYNIVTAIGDKTGRINNQVASAEYKQFEKGRKDGDTVISRIDDAETNPDNISISVTTLRNSTTVYGYSNYEDESYTGYSEDDPGDSDYINPVGSFESSVTKNNGVVTGLVFEQKN